MSNSRTVSIAGIIQHTTQGTLCFDTTYKTVSQVTSSEVCSTVLVLKVIEDLFTTYQYIDFTSFLSKYQPTTTNWTTILSACTDHISDDTWSKLFVYTSVPMYQDYTAVKSGSSVHLKRLTPFPSNMRDHIIPFSMDHSDTVTGSYLNKKAPYIRNIKARIRTMPDVVFTKTDSGDIGFKHTLVSIDGNIGYPEYSPETDELYVKNGAYFLRGTIGPDQNIVFLDFTNFAAEGSEMKSLYFHQCCPELYVKQGDEVQIYHGNKVGVDTLLDKSIVFWKESDIRIKFSVPIDKLDSNMCYFPLTCFGGKLFLPGIDDITYYTYSSGSEYYLNVSLHICLEDLVKIVAVNLQHAGIFLGNSSFYQVAISYILSNIFTAKVYNIPESSEEWRALSYLCKSDIPFISLLIVDKPYAIEVTEPKFTIFDGELAFPKGTLGFLRSKQTREILDFNRIRYKDHARIETEPRRGLYVSPSGTIVSSLNPGQTRVVEMQGGDDIASRFAPGTTLIYSTLDGNCWVARGADGILIAKSETTQGVVTNPNLKWYVYETPITVEDSMKQDAIMLEQNIPLYADEKNRVIFGKNVEDNYQAVLVDIVYAGQKSSLVEVENIIDTPSTTPDIPVHTIEYRSIKNPVQTLMED